MKSIEDQARAFSKFDSATDIGTDLGSYRQGLFEGFLAGYQAAKDEYKIAIDTYNDVAKQMLEEAVRIMSPKDQLADFSKVMCNTTMEEMKAVDTGELMPITNLPTSAKWISVKDRLPEVNTDVLVKVSKGWVESDDNGNNPKPLTYDFYSVMSLYYENNQHVWDTRPVTDACPLNWEDVTHWMPLPEAPKEEK